MMAEQNYICEDMTCKYRKDFLPNNCSKYNKMENCKNFVIGIFNLKRKQSVMTTEQLIENIRKDIAEFQNDIGLAVTEITITRLIVDRKVENPFDIVRCLKEEFLEDVTLLMRNTDKKLFIFKEEDMV